MIVFSIVQYSHRALDMVSQLMFFFSEWLQGSGIQDSRWKWDNRRTTRLQHLGRWFWRALSPICHCFYHSNPVGWQKWRSCATIRYQWHLSVDADEGQAIIVKVASHPLWSCQACRYPEQACDVCLAVTAMNMSHQCKQGQEESTSIDDNA